MQNETITMTTDQLSSFAEMVVNRTLEKVHLLKDTISLAEISKLYGRTFAKRARISPLIKWYPKGSSDRSGVECLKSNFDKFKLTKGLSIYSK